MKTTFIVALLCAIPFILVGQEINFHWAQHGDVQSTFTLDNQENPSISFSFKDEINAGTEIIEAVGGEDFMVIKQDPNTSQVQSYYHWGSNLDEQLIAIDYSLSGDLYITGNFSNALDMDPGNEEFILTGLGDRSKFISKFNNGMEHQWSATFEADYVTKIKSYCEEHILVGGSFTDSLHVVSASGVHEIHAIDGVHSFLINFSDAGEIEWIDIRTQESIAIFTDIEIDPMCKYVYYTVQGISDSEIVVLRDNGEDYERYDIANAGIKDLEIDSEGLFYLCGNFDNWQGGADFDVWENEYILEGEDSKDIFLAKYDGWALIWAIQIAGGNIDTGTALSLGHNDDVYLTGCIQQDADFDPSEEEYVLNALGFEDVFLANYSAEDGSFNWVEVFGGSGADVGLDLEYDERGYIWIDGRFTNEMDFDLSPTGEFILSEVGNNAGYFVAQYCESFDCTTISTSNLNSINIKVFPNPANAYLTIQGVDITGTVLTIYDIYGKTILHTMVSEGSSQINVNELPAGMYFYQLHNEEGQYSDQFIKL